MTPISLHLRIPYRERPLTVTALAYLAGIALAELLVTYSDPRLGMLAHCLLLLVLLFNSARVDSPQERALFFVLAFAPLIRITSLALPLAEFPPLYRFLITSAPLLVAVFAAIRALGLSWPKIGLNLRRWPWQFAIGLAGLAFGSLAYYILRPEPLATEATWTSLALPAAILLLFTGLLEELIFRGLLQGSALQVLERWALLYVALVFAALHIRYNSPAALLFFLGLGLFLGWAVFRTGSLLGAGVAHGLTNVMLFLVMPYLVLRNVVPLNPLPTLSVPIAIGPFQALALLGSLSLLALALVAVSRRRALHARRAHLRARLTLPPVTPERRWSLPVQRYAVAAGPTQSGQPVEPEQAGRRRWPWGGTPAPPAQPLTAPQTRRMLIAAVALVGLRLVRMLWPDPNLAGALTVAEPLLIVWPFVIPLIPLPYADYVVGGAFYALLLLFGAIWRVSEQSAAYAITLDTSIIWMALTIGAAVIGQFLLGRQRLLLLRLALLLLALGAVLGAFEMESAAGVVVLAGGLLVFVQYLIVLRAPQRGPAPSAATAVRPTPPAPKVTAPAPPSVVTSTEPQPAPQPRYLYERRQLLSMRLASIVAYDAPTLPDLLGEMLHTFTVITAADEAYVLLLNGRDAPPADLVLASRYDAVHASAIVRPVSLNEDEAPELFDALRHNKTLLLDQPEGGVEVKIEAELQAAFGDARSGPMLLHPITRGERAYGLAIVGNPYSQRTLTEDDGQLCQVLAARVGAVIARYDGLEGIAIVSDDAGRTQENLTGQMHAAPGAAS